MEEKNNELFQIGEVSKLFHISVGILRHYDKIGLLQPEYINPDTGYRYYSTRQFECLNTIRYLRALDVPLEKIADFLKNRDTDNIHQMLMRQKEEVRRRQEELRTIERKIDNRLSQITDALHSDLNVIKIVQEPKRRIALIHKKLSPQNYLDLEYSIRLLEQSEKETVIFLGKVGIGISREALLNRRYGQYDLVFLILDADDKFQGDTVILPEETCVTIRFQGEHKQSAAFYAELMNYI